MKKIQKSLAVIMSVIMLAVSLPFSFIVSAETGTYNISELDGKYKTQGRTDLTDDGLMLDWSASGIEWKANCSGDVSVTLNTTRLGSRDPATDGGLYFSVFVDGVMQYADLRIPSDTGNSWTSNSKGYPFHITQTGEATFTIATGLDAGEHTFEIYNQTEAYHGAFGIKSITLDGEFLSAPAENGLYIEYVGDSITAGHGNISSGSLGEPPLCEDATRGWAFLAAKKLSADWSIVARSGITASNGMGWAGSGSVSMQTVYPISRYYSDSSTTYDFVREPDVIIVGLGTNDIWTYENCGKTLDDVKYGIKSMTNVIRKKNPNAKIIWIYGMMTSALNDMITGVVSELGGADKGYYSLELAKDTSGGNGHPGISIQETYATAVSNFVSQLVPTVTETVFAASLGAEVGETYISADYSADGATVDGWSAGAIGTGYLLNKTGLKLRNIGGSMISEYDAPNSNFVAKLTVYHTDDKYGIQVGTYSNTTAKATYARIVDANYAAGNQLRFYPDGNATPNYTVTLSDSYDLDDKNKAITLYLFSYNGTVYFVDCDGVKLFEYVGAADKIYLNAAWCELILTEFSVRELNSVFGGGSGTEADPYLVTTAKQLYKVIGSFGGGKHYKLANDIYLNDIGAINWSTGAIIKDGYSPFEWFITESGQFENYLNDDGKSGKFSGTIDGDGYCVYGLWYPADSTSHVSAALIPVASSATISNLGLKNSFIKGDRFAGGIVAANVEGALNLSNVFVDDTVSVSQNTWYQSTFAGGILGFAQYGSTVMQNCYSTATVQGRSNNHGGLFGSAYSHNVTVKNCYSYGCAPYKSFDRSKTNVFESLYSDIECENTTLLTDDQMKGADALTYMNGFSDDIWYSVKDDAKTPMLRIRGVVIGDANENAIGKQSGDLAAIRTTIMNVSSYKNSDFNRDGNIDILDLVSLKKEYEPKITFNANGGAFSDGETIITTDFIVREKFSVEKPKLDGYVFMGWSKVPDGETVGEVATYDVEGSTLYAVWKQALKLASVFSDNMVLQRNNEICIYGDGTGSGTITLGNQTKQVSSSGEDWSVTFDAMEASTTPVTFKTNFSGVETVYNDVLIGDVYITSGQSNMEFQLEQTEQKESSAYPSSNLRFMQKSLNGWSKFDAESVQKLSAVSTLFAQGLENSLDKDIPIGIISTAVGASRVDDWTPIESCVCYDEKYDLENNAHSDYTDYDKGHHDLYAKHIKPLEKLSVAGVLWYQGESNRGINEAYFYYDMFENMVASWRENFKNATLPFYTVQIMLYTNNDSNTVDEYNIRIAQAEAAKTIPYVTVCTMLSYEDTVLPSGYLDIHPTDKAPVAEALVNAVIAKYYIPMGDYSGAAPEYSGPLYDKVTVNGNTATVTFTHTAEGLMTTEGETTTVYEFEVRDSSGNWTAATATLSGNVVTVTANVDRITGVRMGYRNRPTINLYNTIGGERGYCASPFIWTE